MSDPQYQTQKTNISLSDPDSHYFVLSYSDSIVTMNNRQQYQTPIVIFADQTPKPWKLGETIDQTALESLCIHQPELVLIGTGNSIKPLDPEIVFQLHKQGIGVEVMDNHSACRTFNLVIDEGRKALLGLCTEK